MHVVLSKRLRLCLIALTILLGLVVGLIAVEVTLRALLPRHFDSAWVLANEPGEFRFRNAHANVIVRINRYGMRGPESPLEPAQGTARILVIGDSTTWCEGVTWDDTYTQITQEILQEQAAEGTRYEVLNLSKPGAGLLAYRSYWDKAGRRFKPQIVAIGFFMGNDMFSVAHPYALNETKRPEKVPVRARAVKWVREKVRWRLIALRMLHLQWKREPTDIFSLWLGQGEQRRRNNPFTVENLIQGGLGEGVSEDLIRQRVDDIPEALRMQALTYDLDPWLFAAAVLHPQSIRDGQELTKDNVHASWQKALEVLDDLLESIRATGATPVVFAIPRAVQVSDLSVAQFRELGFDLTAEVAASTAPQAYLEEHLNKRGVALIDPLPALRAAEQPGGAPLYFPYDVHLTVEGNRVLGRELATGLLRRCIDCKPPR